MTYTTLMVQVDIGGELNGRVKLAGILANRFRSHLIGICAWMPRPTFAVEGVVIDPALTAADLEKRSEALTKRGKEFKAALDLDPRRIEWRCSQDFPSEYFARESRAADLVIVSRERETHDPYTLPDPGELLLRTGRPVLTVPPNVGATPGQRVIVAWKDTREARRAIYDALPFLRQAETVIVTEICERSEEVTPSQLRLRDVAEFLRRHQVNSIKERVRPATEGGPADSLLRLVDEEAADLIVAGAYGHSRLGEWVFGGMTQGLLNASPVCCLFSH